MAESIEATLDEGTYLQRGGQIRDWIYWSQYVVANNTTPATIFTAKLGDTGFTTNDTTNMIQGGQIPNSQRFDVYGIIVQYIKTAANTATAVTATMAAILAWLNSTELELVIADLSPRFQFTPALAMGANFLVVQQPAATQYDFASLKGDAGKMFSFRRKLTISANTNFKINITPNVAAAAAQTGDILKIGLYGDLWSRS